MLVGVGVILLVSLASAAWWWHTKDNTEEYQALEGEEEE